MAFVCFQLIDIIAKGAYGNVVKGRREDEKQFYAMKVNPKEVIRCVFDDI